MNPEDESGLSASPAADAGTNAAEWTKHEHVSEAVQLEAQKLVHLVGSPELAKNAIDVAEQREFASSAGESPPAPTTAIERDDRFLKALEEFETSLERPVVSGELVDWVTTVHRMCQDLGSLLRDDVQRSHASSHSTILREDPELSSRVEELRATDEQLLVMFDKVALSIQQLRTLAQAAGQDELKADNLRAHVVQQALAFVIGARTQEAAIGTWFSEAFNRDRGFGD